MMRHTKYQDCRSYGFRQEEFYMFFTISAYVKHVTPGVRPFLVPRGRIRSNWVELHQVMLNTKNQDSRPYGFRQKDFFVFLPCKTCDPKGGAIVVHRGIVFIKLGRRPLDIVTYQISRL